MVQDNFYSAATDFVLQAQNLKKVYNRVMAVRDISLNVQRGDIFGFLGPNGSGKTTTIAMMLSLVKPTSGRVQVLGQPVTLANNQALRQVGAIVGATPKYIPYLSALQNVKLAAKLYPELSRQRVGEVLEIVGLSGSVNRKPDKFSTGMKQRLAVAMAILHRPQLLILDEPTNGMDPAGMKDVRDLIKQLAAQGVTIFISSHLLFEVEQVCNRIAVVDQGVLVAEGTIAELRQKDRTVRVKVSDLVAAERALQEIEGVTVTVAGEYLDVAGVDSEAVTKHLVKHDMVPSEVFYAGGDLEDLFIQLTQESQIR
ncbi:Sulfate-transporting ATPase [Thalassoporum mexicanum PCC 7367]|uniref:ABC transporter ATP-binding protein n=1 Tax=Thalassoporum mexicanum TaxID=3457544 RepID=UPI00029FF7F5|nr:ABC transporter ATP-binding protein [Pseudanabaena sp. PCC 7367]AFY69118.1 Sulfate-transporting ATPase [Pseudanabaena sp. PCC 7367]